MESLFWNGIVLHLLDLDVGHSAVNAKGFVERKNFVDDYFFRSGYRHHLNRDEEDNGWQGSKKTEASVSGMFSYQDVGEDQGAKARLGKEVEISKLVQPNALNACFEARNFQRCCDQQRCVVKTGEYQSLWLCVL